MFFLNPILIDNVLHIHQRLLNKGSIFLLQLYIYLHLFKGREEYVFQKGMTSIKVTQFNMWNVKILLLTRIFQYIK